MWEKGSTPLSEALLQIRHTEVLSDALLPLNSPNLCLYIPPLSSVISILPEDLGVSSLGLKIHLEKSFLGDFFFNPSKISAQICVIST